MGTTALARPHRSAVVGVVLAAEHPHFASAFLTDHAGEVGRAEPGVERPHPRAGLAEHRVLGGDRDVAEDVEHVPTADGVPVDGGDDRLGNVADEPVQRLHFEQAGLGRTVVTGLAALFLIASRAEGSVAGPGKGNDADGPIDPRRLEAADQLVHRAAPERVVALGPVDRDPRQSVVDLVHDVGQFVELHDVDTRCTRSLGKAPARRSFRLGAVTLVRMTRSDFEVVEGKALYLLRRGRRRSYPARVSALLRASKAASSRRWRRRFSS